MLKEKRNRKRMGFWIDYGKDDELIVAETIDTLKKQRKYQRAIFQGIQLIASLWEGRVDVLLTMFPWIADTICQNAPPTDDINDLRREIEALRKDLRQQQSRPLSNAEIPDTRNYGIPAMKQSGSGVGTLGAGRTFTLPLVDDDAGDTIVLNKSTGSTSNSQNLMAGIFGLE